jgi:hypothetical protein
MVRVLKTNGRLRISVADFDCIMLNHESSGNIINSFARPLMGGQGYALNFHYGVFTQFFLTELLSDGGFHQIPVWDPINVPTEV